MRLIDLINAPWAITPDMLSEIQGIYARHLKGEKIDLSQLSADTGIVFANQAKGYTVQDGVAVLPMDGVIAKKMNLFSKISGGVSSDLVGRDFQAALADRAVEAIVVAIDSPGGTVDGTPELAALFHSARGVKPVLAHSDGMMCSAAYWIGANADRITISSEVVQVGSIGVVAKHMDISGAEAKAGVKTTEITAGKYKRTASQYGPLSEDGRAEIQAAVDHVYSVFVDDVARARGITPDEVLARMADGRVFHGSKAIEAGLVDGVATLSETIAQAREMARGASRKPRRAGVAMAQTKETIMDLETLKAEHPELVEAITAEALAGQPAAIEAARQEGAAGERSRIAAVREQLIPGHEALIEKLAFDGVSTGADAAMALVSAEKGLREQAQAAIAADAQPLIPAADAGGPSASTMKRAEFNQLAPADQRAFAKAGGKIAD